MRLCDVLCDIHIIIGDDAPLHLGRASSKSCTPLSCFTCPPYQNQRITANSNATFIARIGPSGDQRGYMAITGEDVPIINSLTSKLYTPHI